MERFTQYLDHMMKDGITPNKENYNQIINYFAERGDAHRAHLWVQEMASRGHQVDGDMPARLAYHVNTTNSSSSGLVFSQHALGMTSEALDSVTLRVTHMSL
mmetsp:Transcript_30421/g.59674  ORF Transcript_30421/g.59674 Transcript_30421/m.59674 type:complete len:102 (-) Transcript_30421:372-677(-)